MSKEIRIDGEEVMEFDDKIIFFAYNHEFVEYNNALFCISLKDSNHKNHYYIIADNNFRNVSAGTKRFLVFHELGHIVNGDLEEKNFLKHIIYSFTRRVFGIGNKTEYKADAHAVRHVGKTSALNSMYELLSVKGHQLSRIEMEERIKRIKEGKY